MARHAPLTLALLLGCAAAHAGPLLDAVKEGSDGTALELLARGVGANDADADGTTALHWAVHLDHVDLAAALLRAGATWRLRIATARRHSISPPRTATPRW